MLKRIALAVALFVLLFIGSGFLIAFLMMKEMGKQMETFQNDFFDMAEGMRVLAPEEEAMWQRIPIVDVPLSPHSTETVEYEWDGEARIGSRCVDLGIPEEQVDPFQPAFTFGELGSGHSTTSSLTAGVSSLLTPTEGKFTFVLGNLTDHDIVLQIYRRERVEEEENTP